MITFVCASCSSQIDPLFDENSYICPKCGHILAKNVKNEEEMEEKEAEIDE